MCYHDLFKQMYDINRDTVYPFSERLTDSYKEIDMLVGKMVDEVEDQCRTLDTGSIPWFPAYKWSCLELEYRLK